MYAELTTVNTSVFTTSTAISRTDKDVNGQWIYHLSRGRVTDLDENAEHEENFNYYFGGLLDTIHEKPDTGDDEEIVTTY
jgi:hypothetical protein